MDSDVFRKLCAGVRFSKKPTVPLSSAITTELHNVSHSHTQEESSATENSAKKSKHQKRKKNKMKIAELRKQEFGTFTDFKQLHHSYGIHSQMLTNIEKLGFVTPTPIQIQAIPVMMERHEIMACAPTGSGKTAAFVIPVLHHLREPRNQGFRALILAPTRELAKQTLRVCRALSEGIGFRCHYIEKASTAENKFGPKAKKRFDLLVSTPNRLVYLLKHDPPLIDLSRVEWLIVDESDKLFEEGKTGFRDQLGEIYKACSSNNIRRGMFSATFAYDVEQWCKLTLNNVVQVTVGARNAAAHSVQQELLFVGSESGKRLAIRDIIRKGIEPPVLIFVQSKDRAKELFSELIYDGINVDVIHAEKTQLQRDNTVACFMEGKIWVLICTELMGRGMDFKGINLVINYDFPTTAISYIHRIGRTGRAGMPGKALTFFTEDDISNLRSIASVMREAGCHVPDYMLKLKKPSKKDRKRKVPIKRKRISTVIYDNPNYKKRKIMETGSGPEEKKSIDNIQKVQDKSMASMPPELKKMKWKKQIDLPKSKRPKHTHAKGVVLKQKKGKLAQLKGQKKRAGSLGQRKLKANNIKNKQKTKVIRKAKIEFSVLK